MTRVAGVLEHEHARPVVRAGAWVGVIAVRLPRHVVELRLRAIRTLPDSGGILARDGSRVRHHRLVGIINVGLAPAWTLLDHRRAQLEAVESGRSNAPRLSARWGDEHEPSGSRLYEMARTSILVGSGSLLATRTLADGNIGAWAALALTRTTFEAAFWAQWLLEPARRRDRLERGLRLQWDDRRERKLFAEGHLQARELTELRREHEASCAAIKRDATATGADLNLVTSKISVVDELRRLECAHDFRDLWVGIWRGLSGVQHGRIHAVEYFTDSDRVIGDDGIARVEITLNEERFSPNAMAAASLLRYAFDTYLRRSSS